MTTRFDTCLAFTLQQEGGFVDNPYDPGGATNQGITLATFQQYVPGATVDDLKAISAADVGIIYESGYWTPSRAGELPPGVDLMLFDMAVNAGPSESIRILQSVVGTAMDGDFGPITMAATLAKTPVVGLVMSLASAQYWFYHSLPTWPMFGKGWAKRVKAREDAATMPA